MRRVWVAFLVGLSPLAAACSGGGDVLESEDVVGLAEDATSSSSSSTSSSISSSSSSSTTSTEPAPTGDPEEDVVQTWTGLLRAARTGEPDEEQLAVIESLAGPETVEQLLTPLFPAASNREIEFFPALTAQDDGTYAIDDCLVMNRGISVGPSNWFVGTAEPDGVSPTGWRITEILVINLDPCVPRSIADAAIADYEVYVDAHAVFYDPPDPNSPLIDQTTTGEYKDFVLGLIADLASNGQVLRGRPDTDPKFVAFRSTSELVITDCQDVDPEYGVYVEATGERTDRIAPIGDGELDLRETTMILEGGTWKVVDRQGLGDVQCRTPPTPPTLRIAGG